MRRKVDPEIIEKMKSMEAMGITRSQIARDFGVSPANVTQRLGAKRVYRKRDTVAQQVTDTQIADTDTHIAYTPDAA